jgi:hypothetical protein
MRRFNACKTYAGQIAKGEDYRLLTETITDFVMFSPEELAEVVSKFKLRGDPSSTPCARRCAPSLVPRPPSVPRRIPSVGSPFPDAVERLLGRNDPAFLDLSIPQGKDLQKGQGLLGLLERRVVLKNCCFHSLKRHCRIHSGL